VRSPRPRPERSRTSRASMPPMRRLGTGGMAGNPKRDRAAWLLSPHSGLPTALAAMPLWPPGAIGVDKALIVRRASTPIVRPVKAGICRCPLPRAHATRARWSSRTPGRPGVRFETRASTATYLRWLQRPHGDLGFPIKARFTWEPAIWVRYRLHPPDYPEYDRGTQRWIPRRLYLLN
jgi:hypothetical protein